MRGIDSQLMRRIILDRHRDRGLVKHTMVSENFGLLGGWFRVEVWCYPNGDATGLTSSRIFHPSVQDMMGIA